MKNFATHIVGGEIYYDYLGGNQYKITLKVYRDCFNGIPPLDGLPNSSGSITDPYFSVFDGSFNFVQMYTFPAPAQSFVPPLINSPCLTPPSGVCVEQGIYELTITLPPQNGGYYIAYQRCCRNNTILNLVNPSSVGSTYWQYIPGPNVAAINSCPRFTIFPPIFVCNGFSINFDHSATDPDGDSLAYTLCDPYEGLGSGCPSVDPNNSSCPTNDPPPYVPVNFDFPYSSSYPMSSSPAININPITGLLNGTPNLNGQWVVGVCVEEWRNGVLIATHHRDFQFNVVSCPGLVVSAVQSQTTYCFGYTVTFNNQSINGSSYLWYFGDPTTTADSSTLFAPTYTYPDTGTYTVTLIANPHTSCADTSTKTFNVYPLLDPVYSQPSGQCIIGNSFNFSGTGNFFGTGTFAWTFGSVANPQTSTLQNPNGVVYSQAGTWPVRFTVSEHGCTATYLDSVEVYPVPEAGFNATPVVGCVPYFMQFSDSSVIGTPADYLWDFGDGTSSVLHSPSHIYGTVGVYNVTLSLTTFAGCVGTSMINIPGMVTVQPSPNAGFSASPVSVSIFEPWVYFTDLSTSAVSWNYYFQDGTTDTVQNPQHTYTDPGTFNVMQIVMNEYGCPDTAYVEIKINPEYRFWIPNAFTPFDGNTINPIFKPVVLGVSEYEFLIFDRWGELIYETHETKEGWDGTYKGRKCELGVYVWKVKYRDVLESRDYSKIGHVTLVR
jgi:gliding motility-associated-like protein